MQTPGEPSAGRQGNHDGLNHLNGLSPRYCEVLAELGRTSAHTRTGQPPLWMRCARLSGWFEDYWEHGHRQAA